MAREYIQLSYNENLNSLFDDMMANMIRQSPKYNNNEGSISKGIRSIRQQHLWYDHGLTFGSKHENLRGILVWIMIFSLVPFLLSFIVIMFLDSNIIIFAIFCISAAILGISGLIFGKWFNYTKLNNKQMIEILDDYNVYYNPKDPYQAMRIFVNDGLNKAQINSFCSSIE